MPASLLRNTHITVLLRYCGSVLKGFSSTFTEHLKMYLCLIIIFIASTWRYRWTTVWAITSFCSFSMSTSKNSMLRRSVAVNILPAESAPAASASNSVAIPSQNWPAAIRSFALSFSYNIHLYVNLIDNGFIKIMFYNGIWFKIQLNFGFSN